MLFTSPVNALNVILDLYVKANKYMFTGLDIRGAIIRRLKQNLVGHFLGSKECPFILTNL